MNFNLSLLKGKLSENELLIVSAYVDRNRKGIISELIELNGVTALIPIKEAPIVNDTQIEDINVAFSLRKEGETIFVELIE